MEENIGEDMWKHSRFHEDSELDVLDKIEDSDYKRKGS